MVGIMVSKPGDFPPAKTPEEQVIDQIELGLKGNAAGLRKGDVEFAVYAPRKLLDQVLVKYREQGWKAKAVIWRGGRDERYKLTIGR